MEQPSTVSINAPPMPNQAAVSLSPGAVNTTNTGVTSHAFRPNPNNNVNPVSPNKTPSASNVTKPPLVNSSPVKSNTLTTVAPPKPLSLSKTSTPIPENPSTVSPSQSSSINHVAVPPKVESVNLPVQPKSDSPPTTKVNSSLTTTAAGVSVATTVTSSATPVTLTTTTPSPVSHDPVPEAKIASLNHGKDDGKKNVPPASDGAKSKVVTSPASTNSPTTISPQKTTTSTVTKPPNLETVATTTKSGISKQPSNLNHTDVKNDTRSNASKSVTVNNVNSSPNESCSTLTKKQSVVKNERKRVQVEQTNDRKIKRARIPTQHYQSPIPELTYIPRALKITPARPIEDKMIVFFKGEHLAVRNAEGGFYVCQALQNIHKNSHKIRIRWLSQVDGSNNVYSPDFYDHTEFECILTNLSMRRLEKDEYSLPEEELQRTNNILKRALAFEKGEEKEEVSEEHPDGIDVSILKDESQLKRARPKKKPLPHINQESKSSPQLKRKSKIHKVRRGKHKNSNRAQTKVAAIEVKKSDESVKTPIRPLKINRRVTDVKTDENKKRSPVPKKPEVKSAPTSRSLRGNKDAGKPQEVPVVTNVEGRRKRMGLKQPIVAAMGRKKVTKRA